MDDLVQDTQLIEKWEYDEQKRIIKPELAKLIKVARGIGKAKNAGVAVTHQGNRGCKECSQGGIGGAADGH